jgi:hypothetical protein
MDGCIACHGHLNASGRVSSKKSSLKSSSTCSITGYFGVPYWYSTEISYSKSAGTEDDDLYG